MALCVCVSACACVCVMCLHVRVCARVCRGQGSLYSRQPTLLAYTLSLFYSHPRPATAALTQPRPYPVATTKAAAAPSHIDGISGNDRRYQSSMLTP